MIDFEPVGSRKELIDVFLNDYEKTVKHKSDHEEPWIREEHENGFQKSEFILDSEEIIGFVTWGFMESDGKGPTAYVEGYYITPEVEISKDITKEAAEALVQRMFHLTGRLRANSEESIEKLINGEDGNVC